jgi:hypothetical protein
MRWLSCLALLLAAPAVAQTSAPACTLSASDRAWLDQAMSAWNYTSRAITGIGRVKRFTAIFFDAECMVKSSTAMNGGPVRWDATRHGGQVPMPGGGSMAAGVTSFAMSDDKTGDSYFVMSTPTIWSKALKSSNGLGSLELLMTAVVLHEATHVAQMPTYGARIARLATVNTLPEDFNDDSIQGRFEKEAAFKDSIGREVDLLLAAATARDRAAAVRMTREARDSMRARQARWFTGKDAYLTEAEDVFLTLEGSAQWAAYRWLTDARGGAVDPRAAFGSFGWRGRWWSQNEGFALFMALDRLAPGQWRRHAFGDGAKTVLQMVDAALASGG